MIAKPKPRKLSPLMRQRKWMLWIAVIGTFLIGLRHIMPGEAASGGSFDSFCAFGAIETLWAYIARGQTLKTTSLLNFAVFSGVLAVSLVAGRAFCGWMCALGAVQEGLAKVARRLSGETRHIPGKPSKARFPMRLPASIDRPMRNGKYIVLALVIVVSIFAVYPPLHSFCPFRAVFSFKLGSALLLGVLALFVGTSLLVERFWCKYLCPLGGALAVFNKISPVTLSTDSQACNHCGRCDTECSMDIPNVPDSLRDPECIRCLVCLDTCARDEALTLRIGRP